ncbi:uncharacterized protein RSE6_10611 [Rhynchosporium secalis]|uniref:Uncharacterized protein n=1 Tax=Rhynchosporium secalis TaxID=38038 RepID=A0A1E1MKY1_RHYSE|nr:uncharacterized protein RSE6_10611 [Rhynchosporium secalis]
MPPIDHDKVYETRRESLTKRADSLRVLLLQTAKGTSPEVFMRMRLHSQIHREMVELHRQCYDLDRTDGERRWNVEHDEGMKRQHLDLTSKYEKELQARMQEIKQIRSTNEILKVDNQSASETAMESTTTVTWLKALNNALRKSLQKHKSEAQQHMEVVRIIALRCAQDSEESQSKETELIASKAELATLKLKLADMTVQKDQAELDTVSWGHDKNNRIKNLEQEVARLIDDRNNAKPLVAIGTAIRLRYMATVCKQAFGEGSAIKHTIRHGNTAAHSDNVEADYAVFEAYPEFEERDERHFAHIYGTSPKRYKSYVAYKEKFKILKNQLLRIPKRSNNTNSMREAYSTLREIDTVIAKIQVGKRRFEGAARFCESVAELEKEAADIGDMQSERGKHSDHLSSASHEDDCSCFDCGKHKYYNSALSSPVSDSWSTQYANSY